MTSFWFYNAFQPPFPSQQLIDYSSLVGEAKTPYVQIVPLPTRGQSNGKRTATNTFLSHVFLNFILR